MLPAAALRALRDDLSPRQREALRCKRLGSLGLQHLMSSFIVNRAEVIVDRSWILKDAVQQANTPAQSTWRHQPTS
jgi:hypothetical protein